MKAQVNKDAVFTAMGNSNILLIWNTLLFIQGAKKVQCPPKVMRLIQFSIWLMFSFNMVGYSRVIIPHLRGQSSPQV